jgi:hypothetical protein
MLYNPRACGFGLSQLLASLPFVQPGSTQNEIQAIQALQAQYAAHHNSYLSSDAFIKRTQDPENNEPDLLTFVWQSRGSLNPIIAAGNVHYIQGCRQMLYPADLLPKLMKSGHPHATINPNGRNLMSDCQCFWPMAGVPVNLDKRKPSLLAHAGVENASN